MAGSPAGRATEMHSHQADQVAAVPRPTHIAPSRLLEKRPTGEGFASELSPQSISTGLPSIGGEDVEPQPTPLSKPQAASWNALCEYEYDIPVAEVWNEQVDVLLLFAGLFSAVVTAFSILICRRLQPTVLQFILQELSSPAAELTPHVSNDPNATASSPFPAHLWHYQQPMLAVWVHGLWCASLACSLLAALLGILAKQWLRYYTCCYGSFIPARTSGRGWQQFFHWLVWALPVLLRTSLALFLVGMAVFLFGVD